MAQPRLTAAILIVSDTAAADPSTDECAPVLRDVLRQNEWEIAVTHILADEEEAIQRFVKRWTDGDDWANCILTSGGTGFAEKDITPEVRMLSQMVHIILMSSGCNATSGQESSWISVSTFDDFSL
jgi:gephyrin